MGTDVQLHATGNWTIEQQRHAERLFNDRLPRFLMMERLVVHGYGLVAVTMSSWYGPGYERGHWPTIYTAIRIMQACFPNCTIHYGADTGDPENIMPVENDDLELLWRHFLSPQGNAYHGSSI